MCREYDLILAMEQNHIEAVTRLAMEARGKTFLFGYWLQQMEIPDPYRRGRDISGVIFQQLFPLPKNGSRFSSRLNNQG